MVASSAVAVRVRPMRGTVMRKAGLASTRAFNNCTPYLEGQGEPISRLKMGILGVTLWLMGGYQPTY